MSEKQKTINDVYLDRAGYGSKQRMLSEARQEDKTTTMPDINELFERMLNKKESRKVKTVLSPLIPPTSVRWICFLQTIHPGVLMIVASGMIECFNKMGKKPQILFTDDEGALNKEAIQKHLKDENIERHRTRARPNFSERAIRTFKDML